MLAVKIRPWQVVAALTLLLGAGCNRDPDPRPWMVCYRIYEQCRFPSRERVGPMTQQQCVAYVAQRAPVAVQRMVDCVRETSCPGMARRCVERREDSFDLSSPHMRGQLGRQIARVARLGERGAALVQQQRLCLRLRMLQGKKARLVLQAGVDDGRTAVSVSFNGELLATQTLHRIWQELQFTILPDSIRPGDNELCLRHEKQQLKGHEPLLIHGTQTMAPVDIAVRSGGFLDGNLAEIWVDGRNVSLNKRGINAVTLDQRTGAVVSKASFDLFLQQQGGLRLRRWIGKQPAGAVVVLAVRDEASKQFDHHAQQALSSIGAVQDLKDKYRHGYAAIGVKGASPGAAMERLTRGKQARLFVGQRPKQWRSHRAHYGKLTLQVVP